MVKKLLFLIGLFFSFALLFSSGKVIGKERDNSLGQRWVCLQAKRCDKRDAGCSGNGIRVHRARLSVKETSKPLANTRTYIIEKVGLNGGVPTTGSSELDSVEAPIIGAGGVFGVGANNRAILGARLGYRFEGLFKEDGGRETVILRPNGTYDVGIYPLTSNTDGSLPPLEIQSSTTHNQDLKFFALQYVLAGGVEGENSSEKQGLISFEEANKDCESVHWDPEGRVFDSQSLEPIRGARVTLKIIQPDGSFAVYHDRLGIVNNPVITSVAGEFSFMVPSGTYRLDVSAPDHNFPFQLTNLNSGWEKAYSNLYYGLPKDGVEAQDVIEKEELVHRDIPLDPISAPYERPVKILPSYFDTPNPITGARMFEGRVTHPLSKVEVYAKIPSLIEPTKFVKGVHLLAETQADKYGNFKVSVNQKNLEGNEQCCILKATKVNLRTLATSTPASRPVLTPTPTLTSYLDKVIELVGNIFRKVEAKAVNGSIEVDAAPSYLEGYAYDKYGKVIPNAKVEVIMENSDAAYYITKTDANGYFRVGSQFLPKTAYSLRYFSPAGVRTNATTSDFIRSNLSYIKDNKISLYSYRDNQGKLKEIKKQASSNNIVGGGNNSLKPSSPQPIKKNSSSLNPFNSQNKNKNLVLVMLIIMVVLLGLVIGFLAVFLLKKRQSESGEGTIP